LFTTNYVLFWVVHLVQELAVVASLCISSNKRAVLVESESTDKVGLLFNWLESNKFTIVSPKSLRFEGEGGDDERGDPAVLLAFESEFEEIESECSMKVGTLNVQSE